MATDEIRQSVIIDATLNQIQGKLKVLEGDFQKSFARLNAIGQSALAGIGGALSIGGLVSFGKSVVDLAGNLQDLEDRTGISAQLLSGLKSTLEESGTSVEAFAKGIFTAQKTLGQINDESDSAAQAIKALGLNLDELRNASPEKFLELVAGALGKVDNRAQQNALGFQLLGRQFQELAPALSQVAGRLDEFRRAGMKPEDIKRLDDFGDAITRLGNILQVTAAGPLAGFAEKAELMLRTIGLMPKTAVQNLEAMKETVEKLNRSAANATGLSAGSLALMTPAELDGLAKQKDTVATAKVAIDQYVKARAALANFEKDNPFNAPKKPGEGSPFVPLPNLAGQKKAADEFKKLQEEAAKTFADLMENNQRAAEAAGKDMIAVFGELRNEALTPMERVLSDINARFDEMRGKLIEAGAATGQNLAPFIEQLEFFRRQRQLATQGPTGADNLDAEEGQRLRAMQEEAGRVGVVLGELRDRLRQIDAEAAVFGTGIESVTAKIQATKTAIIELLSQGLSPLNPQIVELEINMKNALDGIANGLQGTQTGMKNVFDGITNGLQGTLQGVLQGTQKWGDAMRQLMANIALSIANELAKAGLNKLLQDLLGGLGGGSKSGGNDGGWAGIIGGVIKGIGSFFGGSFDEGGRVAGPIGAPRLAMVHGGETILPTHRASMGGFGSQVVYNIDARGAERGVSAEVQRAIAMAEERAVDRSVVRVVDERRRSNRVAKAFGK